MELIENGHSRPNRKNLVFSSTGNHAHVGSWLKGKREFDIFLCHYADSESPWASEVEFLAYRKGAKFPNLLSLFREYREVFERYDFFWVVDDDIAASPQLIDRLFSLHQKFKLSVSQPSFDPLGKISLAITKEQPLNYVRYTNFVEVTCPVISKETLFGFLEIYDPQLVGYGVDWWLMNYVGSRTGRQVAIFDCLRVHNPQDWTKGGAREIDALQSHSLRKENFEKVKAKYNITDDEGGAVTLEAVKSRNVFSILYRQMRQLIWDKLKRRIRWALTK